MSNMKGIELNARIRAVLANDHGIGSYLYSLNEN